MYSRNYFPTHVCTCFKFWSDDFELTLSYMYKKCEIHIYCRLINFFCNSDDTDFDELLDSFLDNTTPSQMPETSTLGSRKAEPSVSKTLSQMSETSTSRKTEPSVSKTLPQMSETSPVVSRSTQVVSRSTPGVSMNVLKTLLTSTPLPKNNILSGWERASNQYQFNEGWRKLHPHYF